jgi:hypothetical protein
VRVEQRALPIVLQSWGIEARLWLEGWAAYLGLVSARIALVASNYVPGQAAADPAAFDGMGSLLRAAAAAIQPSFSFVTAAAQVAAATLHTLADAPGLLLAPSVRLEAGSVLAAALDVLSSSLARHATDETRVLCSRGSTVFLSNRPTSDTVQLADSPAAMCALLRLTDSLVRLVAGRVDVGAREPLAFFNMVGTVASSVLSALSLAPLTPEEVALQLPILRGLAASVMKWARMSSYLPTGPPGVGQEQDGMTVEEVMLFCVFNTVCHVLLKRPEMLALRESNLTDYMR